MSWNSVKTGPPEIRPGVGHQKCAKTKNGRFGITLKRLKIKPYYLRVESSAKSPVCSRQISLSSAYGFLKITRSIEVFPITTAKSCIRIPIYGKVRDKYKFLTIICSKSHWLLVGTKISDPEWPWKVLNGIIAVLRCFLSYGSGAFPKPITLKRLKIEPHGLRMKSSATTLVSSYKICQSFV